MCFMRVNAIELDDNLLFNGGFILSLKYPQLFILFVWQALT